MPHALHFLVFTVAGWLNRHQEDLIDYFREENRILREQLGGRALRLTDAPRRRLAVRGQKLGWRVLTQVAGIVTPDTILRWYRQLIAKKYDGGRPLTPRHHSFFACSVSIDPSSCATKLSAARMILSCNANVPSTVMASVIPSRMGGGRAAPALTIYSGESFRFTELHRMSTIPRPGAPVRGDLFVPLPRRTGNMPVVVQFVNGDVKTYPYADAAHRKDSWIAVSKRNPEKHEVDDLDLLDARGVSVVQVLEHGVLRQLLIQKES